MPCQHSSRQWSLLVTSSILTCTRTFRTSSGGYLGILLDILIDLVEELKALLSKFDADIENVDIQYGSERIGDIKHSLASIKKAEELLHYRPSHNVKQGLKSAISWYWEYFSNKR